MEHDDRRDFDFLFGAWRVHNRKLASRLQGSTEWHEFDTAAEARPILGGLGNVDTFRGTSVAPDGKAWEGFTLRLFDPDTRYWSIWWASTATPGQLDPPVIGRFADGRGEFFGEDVLDGKDIRVRFVWESLGPSAARWQQAFSADGGDTWETNWIMTFARVM
jgi:hypothetical protein